MVDRIAAYRGSGHYAFVCYAHADASIVYEEIYWLSEQGVNVWYDEGIVPGASWRAELADAILGADQFLLFISSSSLQSAHCNREINLALDEGKLIVPIY